MVKIESYTVIESQLSSPAYQRIMRGFKLKDIWSQEHTNTFIASKAHLVSEPILSAPCYDSTPFILTMDGCKDPFTGMLV